MESHNAQCIFLPTSPDLTIGYNDRLQEWLETQIQLWKLYLRSST